MTDDVILAVIFVSFLTFALGVISGAILILGLDGFNKSKENGSGHVAPEKMVNKGYQLGMLSIAFGLLFAFRIFVVIETGNDFTMKDWIVFEIMFSGYQYLICAFVLAVINAYNQKSAQQIRNSPNEKDSVRP